MSSPRTSSQRPKSEGALRSWAAVVMLDVGVDMAFSLRELLWKIRSIFEAGLLDSTGQHVFQQE